MNKNTIESFKPYRVGALLGYKDGVVELLGYGTFEGNFMLPEEACGFNFGQDNLRIRLDNGDVVWGCECWWGEEERFKKMYIETAKEVKIISIAEARERGKK